MADANDAQLKIYLFLIRMMNANLPTSVTDIADKFNYTEKDVLRSLMYWESRQLLHSTSTRLTTCLESGYFPLRTYTRRPEQLPVSHRSCHLSDRPPC